MTKGAVSGVLARVSACCNRQFHSSAFLGAKAAPNNKDGKKKVKQGFKTKNPSAAPGKAKKGGMTHLGFRDAVRALKFESNASFGDLKVLELGYNGLENSLSKVVKYSENTEKNLRLLESFKKFQYHEVFPRPVSLVTDNTVAISAQFVDQLENSSVQNRLCVVGEKGIGKSTLLSQVKALAASKHGNDVVLLHFDHPENIVNGTLDYIFNKKLGKYQQPMFTKRWIKKVRAANEGVLRKMPLTRDVTFVAKKVEHNLKKGEHTLYDYVLLNHDFGKVGASGALQFFVEELQHHSKDIPVLVSVDNINALTTNTFSKYRHPDFTPMHFTELEAGNLLAQLISGDLVFKKGGVLAAELSDVGAGKTLSVGLKLEEYDPYWKTEQCDASVAELFLKNGGVRPFHVQNLSKAQTRLLLEFYNAVGALQVREYPTKDLYKTAEELMEEKKARRGVKEQEYDPQAQLARTVENAFTVSSGNPGNIVQSAQLTY